MGKPGSRLAQPLDYAEQCELYRLRQCELRVPATFTSVHEELAALRAEMERELAEVRALTEKDWPLSYAIEPVEELYWRRPLAATMRKATVEKARLQREAAEEAEEKARHQREADEEKARLRREADEERRTYARQKQEHNRALLAAAHTTLTPTERKEHDALRKNWAENGMLDEGPETDPIFSCPDDCGRLHLSLSAAGACANVRRQEAERRRSALSSAKPTTPKPTPPGVPPVPSSGVSRGTSPIPQGGHRPATPAPKPAPPPRPATPPPSSSASPPAARREQVVPVRLFPLVPGLGTRGFPPREQPVPGSGTRGTAPREQPVPVPPPMAATLPAPPRGQQPPPPPMASSRTPPGNLHLVPSVAHSPLAERILTIARAGNHSSVNGIVKALASAGYGARRQDIYAEIGAMLADSRLVKIHDVIKPGRGPS
jgi:hypothetical protein